MMNGQHHQQRRTFRGRGGPTDGRLPKHGFNRKRQAKKSTRSYGDDDDDDDIAEPVPVVVEPSLTGNKEEEDSSSSSSSLENDKCNVECDNTNIAPSKSDAKAEMSTVTMTVDVTTAAESSSSSSSSLLLRSKKKEEMAHLMKRIRQNREAWSLSALALASPEAYRINVLQATLNCVKEYMAILKFYHNDATTNAMVQNNEHTTVQDDNNVDAADTKAMSLAIFELIQHALQCGPLAGGKAGYFKRCGSQVATMVHAWLVELCANQDEAMFGMKMTEKQAMAMEKWKAHALRAAENTKPPSKHVLKNQDAAKKNKAKKNEKRGGVAR